MDRVGRTAGRAAGLVAAMVAAMFAATAVPAGADVGGLDLEGRNAAWMRTGFEDAGFTVGAALASDIGLVARYAAGKGLDLAKPAEPRDGSLPPEDGYVGEFSASCFAFRGRGGACATAETELPSAPACMVVPVVSGVSVITPGDPIVHYRDVTVLTPTESLLGGAAAHAHQSGTAYGNGCLLSNHPLMVFGVHFGVFLVEG